ncbi:class I SAM-dependent methyltransferase [Methylolobus aquaticus]
MTEGFVDRFAPVSAGYADCRPTYPPALSAWLASIAPDRRLAWDCATGSGQAARDLAVHFERVIATDASAAQIGRAPPTPGIEYRVAAAESSGLAAESADLITVAQALHWFAIDRFFAECARVLKPGGVLAVWSYGPLQVGGDLAVDALVRRYYCEIVGPYWPVERALVDEGYASVCLPFPELGAPAFAMRVAWPLEKLLGYLGTWSAAATYHAAVGTDPLDLIRGDLSAAWGGSEVRRDIVWPLVVRVAREPAAGSNHSPCCLVG